jgi:hypothetical protein
MNASRIKALYRTQKEHIDVKRPLGHSPLVWALACSVLAFAVLALLASASARAAGPGPAWSIHQAAQPTSFSASQNGTCEQFNRCDVLAIAVYNVGTRSSEGEITFEDTLPAGIHPFGIGETSNEFMNWQCTNSVVGGRDAVTCTSGASIPALSAAAPISIPVTVSSTLAGAVTNSVAVSGGGAGSQTTTLQVPLDDQVTELMPFEFDAAIRDSAGVLDTQAASHPGSLTTSFSFSRAFQSQSGQPQLPNTVEQGVKQIVADLPPGLIGDATVTPTCPLTGIDNKVGFAPELPECPASSRVGSLVLFEGTGSIATELAIFNMTPERGHAAEFSVYLPSLQKSTVLYADVVGSGADTHVRVISAPQASVVPVAGLSLAFFGNPARIDETPLAPAAFFTAPADCGAPGFTSELHIDSWEHPGRTLPDGNPDLSDPRWKSTSTVSPPVTGCEFLQFKPTVSFKPESTSSDSPTGLGVNIHVPQNEDPNGLATPPLREATVTLPKGLAVNPSSADGLAGCTPAQIAAETNDPGTCPQASQIGEIEISTPLLEHPLPGKVYLGTPECAPCSNADAAAGKLVKLYIEVNDPVSGVIVKLPGSGSLDPASGQITASFKENPQLPFEDLNLSFKGGPRATLTTPPTCGHYTTTTDLKPWSAPQSGPDATPQSSFDLNSGPGGSACPSSEAGLSNKPAFEAGTVTPIAGAYSPFVLKLSREDGSQRFGSLEATLPEGLVGRLAGTPYCPDAAIAAAAGRSGAAEKASSSCPAASEVGTVNVGAGSGTPFYVQGKAYLAGPYKGAPISLVIITPAVAGPFDLGTVVVRSALFVNEYSAQVRAVSDPIPSILAGIPLDVRTIALQLNRPDFTLNPSSCEAKEITGTLTSTVGQSAALKNRFQVGACNALEFKPGLKIALNGQTRRIGHPALKAVLTYPKGQNANVRRALVNLPGSEFLDQGNLNKICTKPVLQAGKCPTTTIYGKAKAWTPLLEKPLEGPVYLVGGFGFKLPALVAELNGQIRVLLVGKVDSGKNKGIRNTFEAVPDAPVSRFVLEMKGGKKYGLLENSQNICKHQQKAIAKFTAQNGKTYDTEPVIQVSCGKGKKKHSKAAPKSQK